MKPPMQQGLMVFRSSARGGARNSKIQRVYRGIHRMPEQVSFVYPKD
jgi:hypothetical protein